MPPESAMPWDIRSEAAKERIIAFGIVVVLLLVAVLFVLAFVGMEFIDSALH
jgi:t-SNARE complex subunit (syntaxin)